MGATPADQGQASSAREGGTTATVDAVSPGGGPGTWLAAKNARDWPANFQLGPVATLALVWLFWHRPSLMAAPCLWLPMDPDSLVCQLRILSTQTFVATLLLPSTPNGPPGREDPVSDDRPRYTPSLTLHSSPSRLFYHCTSIHLTQHHTTTAVCLSHLQCSQRTLGDCTLDTPNPLCAVAVCPVRSGFPRRRLTIFPQSRNKYPSTTNI